MVKRFWRIAAISALAILAMAGCRSQPRDPCTECLKRAAFGDPADSPFVLPYLPGTSHRVFQTYCGPISHGKDGQMSIDFTMSIGTTIVAARAGVVRKVVDRHPDFGREFNFVYVEHEDGTSAFYGHLKPGSALVRTGDPVAQGQPIAASGSSGTSIPHLHFGVAKRWPPRHPDDMPVNFRNAVGRLDSLGGLMAGVAYEAGPVE